MLNYVHTDVQNAVVGELIHNAVAVRTSQAGALDTYREDEVVIRMVSKYVSVSILPHLLVGLFCVLRTTATRAFNHVQH
jgi:hypothetical protein